jgi:hypothetical protein
MVPHGLGLRSALPQNSCVDNSCSSVYMVSACVWVCTIHMVSKSACSKYSNALSIFLGLKCSFGFKSRLSEVFRWSACLWVSSTHMVSNRGCLKYSYGLESRFFKYSYGLSILLEIIYSHGLKYHVFQVSIWSQHAFVSQGVFVKGYAVLYTCVYIY